MRSALVAMGIQAVKIAQQLEDAMTAVHDDLDGQLVVGQSTRLPDALIPGISQGLTRPTYVVDKDAHGWSYDPKRDLYVLWALQPRLVVVDP